MRQENVESAMHLLIEEIHSAEYDRRVECLERILASYLVWHQRFSGHSPSSSVNATLSKAWKSLSVNEYTHALQLVIEAASSAVLGSSDIPNLIRLAARLLHDTPEGQWFCALLSHAKLTQFQVLSKLPNSISRRGYPSHPTGAIWFSSKTQGFNSLICLYSTSLIGYALLPRIPLALLRDTSLLRCDRLICHRSCRHYQSSWDQPPLTTRQHLRPHFILSRLYSVPLFVYDEISSHPLSLTSLTFCIGLYRAFVNLDHNWEQSKHEWSRILYLNGLAKAVSN